MEMEWGWGGRITGIKRGVIFLQIGEFFSFITRVNATLCRGIISAQGMIMSAVSAFLVPHFNKVLKKATHLYVCYW